MYKESPIWESKNQWTAQDWYVCIDKEIWSSRTQKNATINESRKRTKARHNGFTTTKHSLNRFPFQENWHTN